MKTKTHKSITLPVVLSGCRTSTLTLRGEGIHEENAEKDI